MNFTPTANNVVVRLRKTSATTSSGIHIPTAYQNDEPSIAVVESIGPEAKWVSLQDKIVYKSTKNLTIVRDKQENTFIFLEDKDILAIVNDEQ